MAVATDTAVKSIGNPQSKIRDKDKGLTKASAEDAAPGPVHLLHSRCGRFIGCPQTRLFLLPRLPRRLVLERNQSIHPSNSLFFAECAEYIHSIHEIYLEEKTFALIIFHIAGEFDISHLGKRHGSKQLRHFRGLIVGEKGP